MRSPRIKLRSSRADDDPGVEPLRPSVAAGISHVSFVLFIVSAAFAAISFRLFRSAWQARGAEGWLGLAFLCVALSMPLRWLIQRAHLAPADLEPSFVLGGHALMALGLCAFTLFVHRVFRPETAWATAVVTFVIAIQIVSLPALVLFGGHRDEQNVSVLVVGLCRALPFAWGFLESLRYHRLMKRRQALDLADAVVTNRFALFAVWTGALVGLTGLLFVVRTWALVSTASGRLIGSDGSLSTPAWLLALGLLGFGLSAAIALWLSFFPPQPWLDRLRASAVAPAAGRGSCAGAR